MKFAKINSWAKTPTRKYNTDAGLDLYYCADTLEILGVPTTVTQVIPPFCVDVVHTGIAVEVPKGYVGIIKAKSKSNFVVGAGVIDSGYQGEILVKIFNPTEKTIMFNDGDPVAQLLIIPVETPELEEVRYEQFTSVKTDRGNSGGIHTYEVELEFVEDDPLDVDVDEDPDF